MAASLLASAPALAGRFEAFTKKAAEGEKMKVVGATFFGGPGIEQFVSAGELPDGTLVAFGDAWGPQFPQSPEPTVLGKGQHRGLDPYLPEGGGAKAGKGAKAGDKDQKKADQKEQKKSLREDDPDMAGMLVFYAPDLSAVKKVVRFDWGVAAISCGVVTPDGRGLIVAGRCGDGLRRLGGAAVKAAPPAEGGAAAKGAGPYDYGAVPVAGDVYLARLSPTGDRVEWAWVFEGARTPPAQVWADERGEVYADVGGMVRVSTDGAKMERVVTTMPDPQSAPGVSQGTAPGTAPAAAAQAPKALTATNTAHYLAVDPADGSFYYGGDRNTNTGHQPWRQPYLYKFDPSGRRQWKAWEWPPHDCACGGDGNGLCSDSSPRAMDVGPGGDLLVGGWSDGGNSVFTRQPDDVTRPAAVKGFGMDSSGMKGANSLGYVLRLDGKTREQKGSSMFLCYLPDDPAFGSHKGAPNYVSITHIKSLPDGSPAFTGKAATGLIQTPNSFYKYAGDGRGYGGEFVAVYSADFTNLRFSSYLPGCERANVAATKAGGVLVVSRSRGSDGAEKDPVASPTEAAAQKQEQGDYDGHILLLKP